MPIYEYKCHLCGEVADHHCKMDDRLTRKDCPSCGAQSAADIQMSAPRIGTEVKRGEARVIRDERQVTSELGPRWRDAGTTGKPGGAGRKTIFHD